MNLILFSIVYFSLCNWFQLLSFLSVIIGPKYKTSSIDNKWIKTIVKNKTSLTLLDITIFHDKKMYGMMAGLPFWPKMILSAHCVLWHNLQALLIETVFFILGIYVILNNSWSLFMAGLLAIGLSIICVQVLRWGIEYFADKNDLFNSENSIFRFLFHWNIYPAMRIKIAKQRL